MRAFVAISACRLRQSAARMTSSGAKRAVSWPPSSRPIASMSRRGKTAHCLAGADVDQPFAVALGVRASRSNAARQIARIRRGLTGGSQLRERGIDERDHSPPWPEIEIESSPAKRSQSSATGGETAVITGISARIAARNASQRGRRCASQQGSFWPPIRQCMDDCVMSVSGRAGVVSIASTTAAAIARPRSSVPVQHACRPRGSISTSLTPPGVNAPSRAIPRR